MNKKLQDLAKIYYGKSPGEVISRDGCIPIVGTGGVYGFAIEAMFDAGVVVARKGSLGKPSLQKSPFWAVDTTYAVIPNQDIDIDWLYYSLLNFDLTKLNEATGVPSISREWLSKINFRAPSTKEQKKIADCISSVDTTIEKTEALIEKYQQIKAGLMHDLFTRGVLPDGKLRPTREQAPELYRETGIGWIPKEWGIQKVEDCGEVKLGRQRSPDQHSGKWTTPYLRVANVLDGVIDYGDVLEMDFTPTERKLFELYPGDILLNEGQSLELVGRSAIYRGEPGQFCFQNTLVRFRCTPDNHASFFAHLFKLWLDRGAFQIISKQTTSVAHLGADRFAKMVCPKIGLHEQKIIAQRLNSVDERIAKTEAHRKNLAYQKAGLMHDLLTGKVAVKVDAPIEQEA